MSTRSLLSRMRRVERIRSATIPSQAIIILARNAFYRERQLAALPHSVFDGRTPILTITGLSA